MVRILGRLVASRCELQEDSFLVRTLGTFWAMKTFYLYFINICSTKSNSLNYSSFRSSARKGYADGTSTYSCTWAVTKEKNCVTLWSLLLMWITASLWTTQDSKRRYSTNSRQTICISVRLASWSYQVWNLPKVRTLIRAFKNHGADL